MKTMQNLRKLWAGVAGGLAIALIGPASMAVGHEAHPIGESAHPKAGALFGTVTDGETGAPIDEVCVDAIHRWRGYGPRARTSNGGHYFFDSLPPGGHILRVDPNCQASPTRGTYAFEWFDDQIDRDRATTVKIVAAQTTVTDVTLERSGSIALDVTDGSGADVDTCVSVYPADVERFDVSAPDQVGSRARWLITTLGVVDGERTIGGLRAGSYRLLVGCLGSQRHESPAPFGYIPRWSPLVEVSIGGMTPVTSTLTRAGVIAGTVRDQDGIRREARLSAFETAGRIAARGYAYNGFFATGRLSPGTYRLNARNWYSYGYFDEWYDDHASSYAGATSILVDAGASTTINVDVLREVADFAVTELTVTEPEIGTALGGAPSVGVRKEVSVTVAELNAYPYYDGDTLCVWAESRSTSTSSPSRTLIAAEYLEAAELREPQRFTYSWTPVGAVGDLRIRARLRQGDANPVNDQRVVETAVAVSGAGGIVAGNVSGYQPPYLFGYGGC